MITLNFMARLKPFFAHLPSFLRSHRRWVWVGYTLVMLVLAFGVARFEFALGSRNPLEADDPIRLSLEELKEEFGGNSIYPILYRPKDGNLFSGASLKAIKDLHDELSEFESGNRNEPQALTHIVDVRSIIYTNYTDVVDDTLSFRPFVGASLPITEADMRRYQELAHSQRDYVRTYFSENGEYGNLWVYTDYGAILKDVDESSEDATKTNESTTKEDASSKLSKFKSHTMQEYVDFQRAISSILEKPEYTHALEFLPPAWRAKYRKDVFEPELNQSLILALLAGVLIQLILFRSLSTIFCSMVIIGSSLIAVLGIAGWFRVIIDLELYIVSSLTNDAREAKGSLVITTSVDLGSTWLAPKLTKFCKQYPGLELKVLLSEERFALHEREADVAIRFGRAEHLEMHNRYLMTLQWGLYAHRDH